MIKYKFFVNKDLPAHTQRSKHEQKIFDLFKLIIKDTTEMPLT